MTEQAAARHYTRRFTISDLPAYLEWYRCYDDPGRSEWISGEELRDNDETWDERQKAKWRFFYQPIASAVGRPQRGMIHADRLGLQAILEERKRTRGMAVVGGIGAALLAVLLAQVSIQLILVPLAAAAFGCLVLYWRYQLGLRQYDAHLARIAALEEEIVYLRRQMPIPPSAAEVEGWLEEELRNMEPKCLSEIVGGEVDEARMRELLRNEKIDERVYGLLVDGWGVLQPVQVPGPLGFESTGVQTVAKDLDLRILTFRKGRGAPPLCRVLYLQYVFPLEHNLNVYAFFYDFVTRKRYGRRWETYQYNHVTSLSVREVELDEESCVRNVALPEAFKHSFFGKQIQACTLVMGGASHFRCVLTDGAVVSGMNEWLASSSKVRELGEVARERQEELSKAAERDHDLAEALRAEAEEARRQYEQALQDRERIEDGDLGKAYKALRCIRHTVECATSRGLQGRVPLGSEPGPYQEDGAGQLF